MPTGKKDDVSATSVEYDEMAEKWELIDDLMKGTKGMRAAGQKWLPKEPKELDPSYNNRLARSFLLNGFKDTIRKIKSKPFSKPVTVTALPERLVPLEEDADGAGRSLTQLAGDLLKHGLCYGKMHVFVDFPDMPPNLTLEDERELRALPRLIAVPPPSLIGWRSETDPITGRPSLAQVRMREVSVEPNGEFLDEEVERVRVVNAPQVIDESGEAVGEWQVWKRVDDDKWEIETKGTHTFPQVPLATGYLERTGFMTSDPPLEDLAWINLAHWQSNSDQRNVLRFARTGFYFARGWTKTEIENGIIVASNQVVGSVQADADLKVIEYQGTSIAAGRIDLQDLKEEMELLGMQPMVERSGKPTTATEKSIDETRGMTLVQSWIREVEQLLEEAIRMAAEWLGIELPADFAVDIFNDFSLGGATAETIANLILMRRSREISRKTFLEEVKRRGVLGDLVDVDAEIQAIEDEGPDLGELGSFGEAGKKPGEDDEDEED